MSPVGTDHLHVEGHPCRRRVGGVERHHRARRRLDRLQPSRHYNPGAAPLLELLCLAAAGVPPKRHPRPGQPLVTDHGAAHRVIPGRVENAQQLPSGQALTDAWIEASRGRHDHDAVLSQLVRKLSQHAHRLLESSEQSFEHDRPLGSRAHRQPIDQRLGMAWTERQHVSGSFRDEARDLLLVRHRGEGGLRLPPNAAGGFPPPGRLCA